MGEEHQDSDECWCNPTCRVVQNVAVHGEGCNCHD